MNLGANEKYFLMKELDKLEDERIARLILLDTIPDYKFDLRNAVIEGLLKLDDEIIQRKNGTD